MSYYFQLQYWRFKRKLIELGVHPWIGCLLLIAVFIVGSKLLFYKLALAGYAYSLLAIVCFLHLESKDRTEQLEFLFPKQTYQAVRSIENIIVALPFCLYLCYEQAFLFAIAVLSFALLVVLLPIRSRFQLTIPTPFKRFPFEFIIGFRKTFWLVGISYFLLAKAIQVQNYNLGAFALGLIFLICMSYYFKPEERYFAWIFALKPKAFLRHKLCTGIIGSTLLSMPSLLALILAFPAYWAVTLAIQLVGYILLSSMILAKYSAFPKEMSLPQALLYGVSFSFPPMLFIVMIIFYKKSLRNLKEILQ